MTREERNKFIDELAEKLSSSSVLYLADTSELTVENTNNLRRSCHKNNVTMKVVKNKLLRKAFERVEGHDYSELYETLSGPTSLMFSEVANAPARLIKDFRKKHDKPILKGAFIEQSIYVGDDLLESLATLKSKEELVGEIIGLLQSPIKNVVSALQSGGNTISGLVKALEERA
ncbi:MAG: 50S ribosomal protein L10 [Flavobacteriales bacterium]|nr:50S ribosomal protein L10 [Flavobacteriales bacterium]